ncbi:MAG: class I SAM-dependent methyltransferase [Candidatus Krumholzibacteriia bacterium]
MIQRITVRELSDLTSESVSRITPYDRDEMAIPSYLHKNPLIRWLMWRRYEYIADLSRFTNDMNVLEFGCGSGVFLPELGRSCSKVYAIDIFPEYAKALCAALGLGVEFIADVGDVPEGSLDVIVAADVLEHIEADDLVRYLSLFSTRLKDDGRLIISGPTESRVYHIGRVLAGFGDKGDYHVSNIHKLITTIESRDYRLARQRTLPFRLPPHLFKVCEFKKSGGSV